VLLLVIKTNEPIKGNISMKKVYITLIMAMIAISGMAQVRQPEGRGYMGANPRMLEPTLTAEQSQAIAALRSELSKELLQVNNQMAELRAQLRTLQQVDKPDLRAIDKKIDQVTDLQNKRMKLVARTEAKIRENLTEEQRLQYDLRRGKRASHFRNVRKERMPMNNMPGSRMEMPKRRMIQD
jgi:Spy/CpxP family protein refolding chaperone